LSLPDSRIGVVGVIIVGHIVSTGSERELDDDWKFSFDGKSEMIFDGKLSTDLVICSVREEDFIEI